MPKKGKKTLLSNSFAVTIQRLAQSITSFILTIIIVRYLGTFAQGQYALGYSYYLIFISLISRGLQIYFTREVAQNLKDSSIYFVNGSIIQIIFALFGYLVLFLLVTLLPYQNQTAYVCYIIGLGIIPFSMSNITEAIFQAHERMHLIAFSTVPGYILRLIIMWLLLVNGQDIVKIAWFFAISEVLVLLLQWAFITRVIENIQFKIDFTFIWTTLRNIRIFLAIEGVLAIRDRLQLIILSVFGGEILTGLYSIILQLIRPFTLVTASIILPLFPRLAKAAKTDLNRLRVLSERMISLILFFVFPLIVGFVFVGEDFLIFIYNDPNLIGVAPALIITGIGLLGTALTRPLGLTMIVSGNEALNLRVQIISVILSVFLSIVLIKQFQLLGAALASASIEIIAGVQFLFLAKSHLFHLKIVDILKQPIILAVGLMVTFIVLNMINWHVIVQMIIAGCVYSLMFMVIIINYMDDDNIIQTTVKRFLRLN